MSGSAELQAPRLGFAAVVLIAGCSDRESPDAAPATEPPAIKQPAAAAATPLGFGPIGYFENHCARCHGPYGSFYGDEFAASLEGDHLREVVKEMVFGAAQSSLKDPEIDLLTAYHRSMVAGEPFLVVMQVAPELGGEVTPGAAVMLLLESGEVAAKVDGHGWTADVQTERVREVRAELNGRTAVVRLDSKTQGSSTSQ